MRTKLMVCLLSAFFMAGTALADSKPSADEMAVKNAVQKRFPDIQIDSLQKTQ